ncbi:hypothetical protein CTI14_46570, partial [Methylobacterium radiotolerans]
MSTEKVAILTAAGSGMGAAAAGRPRTCSTGFRGRVRPGARPAGGRSDRQAGRPAGGGRCRQCRLAR